MPRPMSAVDPTMRQSVNYAHTVNFNIGHATKMNTLLDEMGKVCNSLMVMLQSDVPKTLNELHGIAQAFLDVNNQSVRSKHKDVSKEPGFFGLFSKGKRECFKVHSSQ